MRYQSMLSIRVSRVMVMLICSFSVCVNSSFYNINFLHESNIIESVSRRQQDYKSCNQDYSNLFFSFFINFIENSVLMKLYSCTGHLSLAIYIQMYLSRFILFLSCLFLSVGEIPTSNCLGGCVACQPLAPQTCLPLLNQNTGTVYPCINYYNGPNCTNTAATYYNFYKEGPFNNWSLPDSPPSVKCILISRVNGTVKNLSSSYDSIGPFSSSFNATKALQFSSDQGIKHLIIKMTVAISDSVLSNSSLPNQTVNTNGQAVISTVASSNNTIPFLTLDITDILNSNAVIGSRNMSYEYKSLVETSCGLVYQYQFTVDSNGSLFRQLMLNFYQPSGSLVVWNLLEFTAEGGCSGFTISSSQNKCDTCLSGFYPQYNADNTALYGCNICDYRCNTCSAVSTCNLCQAYSTLNSSTGLCDFPSDYLIYTDNFQVKTGSTVNNSNNKFMNMAVSLNQTLNIGLQLSNNQSYLIKFYLLYSANYANNLSSVTIAINGQTMSTLTSLDQLTSTLDSSNGAAAPLFAQKVKFDLMNQPVLSNVSLVVNGSSTSGEEFYMVNLVIIQYQCIQNCLKCGFIAQQTAACTQCKPFFSLTSNCRSCANGFFLRNSSTCVKCYSNCKQCNGASSYACTECFDQFRLSDYLYNTTCISCLYNFYYNSSVNCNGQCPSNFTIAIINQNGNCTVCMNSNQSGLFYSNECNNCWLSLGLAGGKCTPTVQSGYTFYASDLGNGLSKRKSWSASKTLTTYNCTQDYPNLLGIAQRPNKTQTIPSNFSYTLSGLPGHLGLIVVLNMFKIDQWANSNSSLLISITITSPDTQASTYKNTFTNSYGGNICGGPGNQMIWAIQIVVNGHFSNQVTFVVSTTDEGIFARQLQIYLGNCYNCQDIGLSFGLTVLPMYSGNSTQTGLDVWVIFNHPITLTNSTNRSQSQQEDLFVNSFQFTIDYNSIPNYTILQNALLDRGYIKYFLPLSASYINSTLTAHTTEGGLVYSQDGDMIRQLISSTESIPVSRYDNVQSDTRKTISQIAEFFLFFTWFALITMIVCVLLGVGVIFQQFLLMLQIIYLHIYITSQLLAPSMKIPLASATRMQHLNYFSNIASIQNNLFSGILIPSSYIFTQYNIDVYFLRSIYPVLIINAIFIGWFVILKLVHLLSSDFRESEHRVVRFLRSIPVRPLAYFDQICRYQFLTVMWAVLIQFTNFTAMSSGQIVNLIICVAAFIFAAVWPVAVTIYVFKKHFTTNVNSFRYLYNDLFYLKISSVADEPKFYMYTIMRTVRLFIYASFIALSTNTSVIGPVILIFANMADGVFAYFLDIYREGIYLATRIIENLLLSIAAVLCLVIFGFSNMSSFSQESYENIGFGLDTVFVLAIINGILRVFYLGYKKVSEWRWGTYDIGEHGEKQNYDDLRPIKQLESERA